MKMDPAKGHIRLKCWNRNFSQKAVEKMMGWQIERCGRLKEEYKFPSTESQKRRDL